MGIGQSMLYYWKKNFGGSGITELRRLRELDQENHQLKKLFADLSLSTFLIVIMQKCYDI